MDKNTYYKTGYNHKWTHRSNNRAGKLNYKKIAPENMQTRQAGALNRATTTLPDSRFIQTPCHTMRESRATSLWNTRKAKVTNASTKRRRRIQKRRRNNRAKKFARATKLWRLRLGFYKEHRKLGGTQKTTIPQRRGKTRKSHLVLECASRRHAAICTSNAENKTPTNQRIKN